LSDIGEDDEVIPSELQEFPDVVNFVGVGNPSMKSAHLISIFVVAVGLLIAAVDYPIGLIVLVIFILIALGFEVFISKWSTRPVKVSLHLRKNPVEASQGMFSLGPITQGTIEINMEDPRELGYRPAQGKELLVWKFETIEDARTVAKRLLMYLQRDAG
jgi:hypothetical protein